jgi:hypothetical protein
MDILTLGKMNAMSRDVDVTLEYLANATFQGLKDICDVQEGMQSALETTAQDAVNTVCAFGASGPQYVLYVGCNHNDGQTGQEAINYNGHQCDWTVPADTKGIKFEVYGGGASGWGACCCMMVGQPGGAGGYIVKHLNKEDGDFTPGSSVYAICSAGTGCCYPGGSIGRGHTSYVTGDGLSNLCAIGGHVAQNQCHSFNCYTCCHTCFGCAHVFGGDYGIGGRSSWHHSNHYCAGGLWQVASGAPGPLGTGDAHSPDACTFGMHSGGSPASPGVGGYSGMTSGSCCCGKAGGGGAVVVTYWK